MLHYTKSYYIYRSSDLWLLAIPYGSAGSQEVAKVSRQGLVANLAVRKGNGGESNYVQYILSTFTQIHILEDGGGESNHEL